MKPMLTVLSVALAAIFAASVIFAPASDLSPQQRINEGFEAAASRPLTPFSSYDKGVIVPTPIKTLDCTKRFCEPHRSGTDHIKPFEGSK